VWTVKSRADMPDEMRFTALGSKHASEKERTACLHRFDINPEGPGGAGSVMPSSIKRFSPPTDQEISIGLCAFEDVIVRSHHHR
jgi:hypothetical protein